MWASYAKWTVCIVRNILDYARNVLGAGNIRNRLYCTILDFICKRNFKKDENLKFHPWYIEKNVNWQHDTLVIDSSDQWYHFFIPNVLNIPNVISEFAISIILSDYKRFFYSHNNLDITGIISCSVSLISCHVASWLLKFIKRKPFLQHVKKAGICVY